MACQRRIGLFLLRYTAIAGSSQLLHILLSDWTPQEGTLLQCDPHKLGFSMSCLDLERGQF